jgi:pyruvate ferredoxin oxidoreductase gamma subunit
MIRVRFHGRGGQGVKTASRIVGTAATLDGRVAQDSPVYGAERRGAPMTAYVRISSSPIFERGAIASPDILLVADDTLLDDPAVQPLTGLAPAAMLVLSTSHSDDDARAHTAHRGPILARDFLTLALGEVGTPVGVSTALAAVACALLGITDRAADEALIAELTGAGLGRERVEKNLRLAALARSSVTAPIDVRGADGLGAGAPVVSVPGAPVWLATPSIVAVPNTRARRTGSWRVFRPVIALDRCTRCWICFAWCPDGAIALDAADTPSIDEEVCKGCLICAEECPREAITVVREVREWQEREVLR